MYDYWQKQTADKPLFPEILWSRPENRSGAGKLLIVGGHYQSIAAPLHAYSAAEEAGVGTSRVILPDHVKKVFGAMVAEAEFAPSNPSGGFAAKALDELLMHATWADAVLLAGDFGRNSETSVVLEKFLQKTTKPVIITHDAVECLYSFAPELVGRPNTLIVASFAQAQKLATAAKSQTALRFDSPFLSVVENLHKVTENWQAGLLTRHLNQFFVCYKGQVVTSQAPAEKVWRVKTAAKASVFWLQNPAKFVEAITSSLIYLDSFLNQYIVPMNVRLKAPQFTK